MSKNNQKEQPLFRFLTANQLLELNKIGSRQSLIVQPQPRHVTTIRDDLISGRDDDALVYIFISHRWTQHQDPDADGVQLAALKKWLGYVRELLKAITLVADKATGGEQKSFAWATTLDGLVEGMPQASSLVSRIVARYNQEGNKNQARQSKSLSTDPFDHIYLWYDCACLPQSFPSPRTDAEKEEFSMALQGLDQLAQECELVCLDSPDYFGRAWCALEHFQKSLRDYQGHITLDCDRVLAGATARWYNEEAPTSFEGHFDEMQEVSSKYMGKQVLDPSSRGIGEQLRRVMSESRRVELQTAQTFWDSMHTAIASRRKEKPAPVLAAPAAGSREESGEKGAAGENEEKRDASGQSRRKKIIRLKAIPRPKGRLLRIKQTRKDTSTVIASSPGPTAAPPPPPPLVSLIRVHDLERVKVRLENSRAQGKATPLVSAMTQLVRELFTALFSMSCRDAATLSSIAVPPNHNACIENVGIQCGLHDHRQARPLEVQSRDLNQCIETGWRTLRFGSPRLLCPQGHRMQAGVSIIPLACDGPKCLQPNIQAGHVHATCVCDYDLCFFCATQRNTEQRMQKDNLVGSAKIVPSSQQCLDELVEACNNTNISGDAASTTASTTFCERRVTLDVFKLSGSILDKHGLACTNDADVAFVGLLALRNILALTEAEEEERAAASGLQLSAGALRFFAEALEGAVALYANLLATKEKGDEGVKSLVVTISFSVPRWVLLDMACSKLDVATSMTLSGSFNLGRKCQEYLETNPGCISHTFDAEANNYPLRQTICQQATSCVASWAPCQHETQKSLLSVLSSVVRPPSTLDPWVSAQNFPTPLAAFASVVTPNRLFVLGGSPGDEDPETKSFVTCLSSVYAADLPLSSSTTWSRIPADLNVARRAHTACLKKHAKTGAPSALIVSGGRGTTVVGGPAAQLLSSMEVLQLEQSGDVIRKHASIARKESASGVPGATTVQPDRGVPSLVDEASAGSDGRASAGAGASCGENRSGAESTELTTEGGAAAEDASDDEPESFVEERNDKVYVETTDWTQVSMPRARSGHHMACQGDCVFVFCGNTEPDAQESRKCDIYDFQKRVWIDGPLHPVAFYGGSSIVVDDRYAWVFGGVSAMDGQTMLQASWILDMQPWVGWIASGCPQEQRPATAGAWIRGPDLPTGMAGPNICFAPRKETGLGEDWVLSVGSMKCGNFCYGLSLQHLGENTAAGEGLEAVTDDQSAARWFGGVTGSNESARWETMGAIPDGQGLGAVVVAGGSLVMLCGLSLVQSKVCNTVHFRSLRSSRKNRTIFPAGPVDPHSTVSGSQLAELMKPTVQKLLLNDQFLVGRLGFPFSNNEEELFAGDGTKRLSVMKADDHVHCQRCLVRTQSLTTAREHNDTALFGVRPRRQLGSGSDEVNHRTVALCSVCLCDLYFNL